MSCKSLARAPAIFIDIPMVRSSGYDVTPMRVLSQRPIDRFWRGDDGAPWPINAVLGVPLALRWSLGG